MIKQKIQIWARLPLGVVGRINLIKMVLLPKILYMIWHSPVYLILRHFKIMETLLKPFVWGNNRHKLLWHKLINPTDLAGLALPDLNMYYLASQRSQIFHSNKTDGKRFLFFLCPKWIQQTLDPLLAITGGGGRERPKTYRRSLLYQYKKIWDIASKKLHIESPNAYPPLWHNESLPEFGLIQDSGIWSSRGIIYLFHITNNGKLKTFETLKCEFALPNQMFFRYIQLRHAFHAQYPADDLTLKDNPLMAAIKFPDPKKLISQFYAMLTIPRATVLAYALKSRWEGEIGTLEDDEWSDALDTCKLVSPKISDRLTQIFITHKAYLTPLRVSRYKSSQSANCPMRTQAIGTTFHLLWQCPKIQQFWTQVVKFLHDTMGSPIMLQPKQCLLGTFPDPELNKFTKIFLHESLFSARKVIARVWMRPTPPEFSQWVIEVNNVLPYKKLIYSHRGCPTKYEKIWERWVKSSETCINSA